MTYELPKLDYEYDALEPFIDAKTMEIHHTKHHQAYINKLNAALENHADLREKDVKELLENLNSLPEEIRTAVRNHGGGHYNHSLFWKILKKEVPFEGEVAEKINETFGSFEEFKKQFSQAAMNVFGSGWAWLVFHNGELKIMTTPNQDSPVCTGYISLLGIDVWEHSFYLQYGPNRLEYVNAFFNIINWDQVNTNYLEAQKQ